MKSPKINKYPIVFSVCLIEYYQKFCHFTEIAIMSVVGSLNAYSLIAET